MSPTRFGVDFMAPLLACATSAGSVFVTTEGALVYSFPGKAIEPESSTESAKRSMRHVAAGRGPGWALSETPIDRSGQARAVTPAGLGPNETKVSYFTGKHTASNKRPINTYYRVQLGEVYPGVNLQLRAIGNNMEKIFTVAPGQNPSQIQLKLDGAERLEISAAGQLAAHTGNGRISFSAPIAFQEYAKGNRDPDTVAYALDADQARNGFTLGPFDESRPLTIDPLLQSSYLGGSGPEQALALTVHPANGEVIVVGITGSANLPVRAVGAQTTRGGIFDAFVSRLTSNLSATPCKLDINGDDAPTPDKDGVLLLRYALGFRGATLIVGVPLGAASGDATAVETFIGSSAQYQVFGQPSGFAQAMQDGLVLLRLMRGVGDSALLNGIAPPTGATFTTGSTVRANVNARRGTAY